MRILIILALAAGLAAQDKPAGKTPIMQATAANSRPSEIINPADLQTTIDTQAKLIDWLKQQLAAVLDREQKMSAYLQSVLKTQSLEAQRPPDVKPATEKGTK